MTLKIAEGMVTYDGNPGFRLMPFSRIARGGSSNNSYMTIGTHLGTHVDAPLHVAEGAGDITTLPPEVLIGPCRLFHLPVTEKIDAGDLAPLDWNGVERALFRTSNSDRWASAREFDPKFIYLTGAAAEFLAGRKIKLVGVDYLSVDRFRSGTHPAHHALIGAGVVIVEGLDLSNVPPGDYRMFCGPLKIAGGDGAPARVFLEEV
ncbi:MAG: cyclase family protein [Planctomycetota bacterium]